MKGYEKAAQAIQSVKQVIIGKDDCVLAIMEAILANGHILIEDIPGVGKTSMALAFARVLDMKQSRVQFTPDVLPTDITGFSVYRKELGRFDYEEGAVMCNLFLADEINRTSPKTQSALLEVMEERTVTVDGVTHPVPRPFHVIATENPIGSAGTQMLPESQLDRFMISISMGYPNRADELCILMSRDHGNPMENIMPSILTDELVAIQKEVEGVFVHRTVYEYIVSLVEATRNNDRIELGVSPRGALALARMSKAAAYVEGREYVLPRDVASVFINVARHRIVLSAQGRMYNESAQDILAEILASVKQPTPQTEGR